jgi:hypothetical protein
MKISTSIKISIENELKFQHFGYSYTNVFIIFIQILIPNMLTKV